MKILTDALREVQLALESDQTAKAIAQLQEAAAQLRTDVDSKLGKDEFTIYTPTLLGGWEEHPTFGECLAVRTGRVCTLSGWLLGNDPWDSKNSQVLQLPEECRPTRDIAVSISTKGAVIPAMIHHEEGKLWLYASDAGERPTISSDMASFTVTYIILDD